MSFGLVGRGVPAEPLEHRKPLMYALIDHFPGFLQDTNRGLVMLRLGRDASPYQSKVRVLSLSCSLSNNPLISALFINKCESGFQTELT